MTAGELVTVLLAIALPAAFVDELFRRRDRWGINLKRTVCAECGTEMEKWGNRI